MRVPIKVPQTGTQTEVTFIEWLVPVGTRVSEGTIVGTVETEKAVVDIEAPSEGIVTELLAIAGATVNAGQELGYITGGENGSAAVTVKSVTATGPAASSPASRQEDAEASVSLSPVRRRIAENLLWVTNNTARASTTVEVDFETVAATRATHAEGFRSQQGFSLTFLPFVAFTVLRALEKYPDIAAKVDLSANRWIVPQAVHLGIAVSREAGLTVPVIHDAQRLTFTELAIAIERAATAVRSGTLKPSDTQGGTLTITNPGSFGSYVSQPIVNRGESSILCVDGIEKRAVFVNGEIVARLRGFLTLAFDHCVVDGRAALTFLNHVKSQLQSLDDTWLQR